jgi:hypothetical protein
MTTSGTATTSPLIANGIFTASGLDGEGSQADRRSSRTAASGLTTLAPSAERRRSTRRPASSPSPGRADSRSAGHPCLQGISGSGKVVISIVGIFGRTKIGACSENGKPVAWQQNYRGTAHIKL